MTIIEINNGQLVTYLCLERLYIFSFNFFWIRNIICNFMCRYCLEHECPDRFKCPGTYCIDIHLVCDGIADCPDDADETGCQHYVTAGLLR